MKSIKIRLIAIFTVIILVITLGVGLVSVNIVTNKLTQKAHSDLERMALSEAKYIEAIRDTDLKYIDALAQNKILIDETVTRKEKVQFFESEAERTGYMAFAFADKQGNSITFNQDGTTVDVNTRDYYQRAIKGESAASDMMISAATGDLIIIYAAPVKVRGEIVGVFYGRKSAAALSAVVDHFSYQETGYQYIMNEHGNVVAHKDTNMVLEQFNMLENAREKKELKDFFNTLESRILKRETGSASYFYGQQDQIVGFAAVEGSPWVITIGIEAQEVLREVNALRNMLIIISVIALLIGIAITYFVSQRIALPISDVTGIIQRLSEYDFTIGNNFKIEKYFKRPDEIGKMANALTIMQKNIGELIGNISQSSESVAASSEELTATTQQTSTAAEGIVRTIEEIANGASEQAKETEKAFQHITKLGRVIENENLYTQELKQAINKVNQLKEEGIKEVEALVCKTQVNQEASQDIGEVIMQTNEGAERIYQASQMIKSIADQTNLLALNAAIESARAGEAGRGFAVVAEEIRKLAEQSERFTGEISEIIKDLTAKTSQAVDTMKKMNTMVKEQTQSVGATKDKFEGIAQAVEETQQGIEKLTESAKEMKMSKETIVGVIESLSAIAEENAAGTEEAAASVEEQTASMEQIASTSEALAKLAEEMNIGVAKFKY